MRLLLPYLEQLLLMLRCKCIELSCRWLQSRSTWPATERRRPQSRLRRRRQRTNRINLYWNEVHTYMIVLMMLYCLDRWCFAVDCCGCGWFFDFGWEKKCVGRMEKKVERRERVLGYIPPALLGWNSCRTVNGSEEVGLLKLTMVPMSAKLYFKRTVWIEKLYFIRETCNENAKGMSC